MRPLLPWCPPPDRFFLEPGSLHLWRVRLELPASTSANPPAPRPSPTMGRGSELLAQQGSIARNALFRLLSPDERVRAERLRIPAKAQEFLLGRARLRQILAHYLDRAPAELAFTYGPHGKPALAAHDRGLHFNLAHSGDWMLLAVTSSGPVGVDLEGIDPVLDFVSLARRYFSSAEQEVLMQASPWRRRRTFYRLWTRKEAYLKGRGGGFAGAVGEEVAGSGWCTGNFFVGRDHVAALAVEGKLTVVRRWAWTRTG